MLHQCSQDTFEKGMGRSQLKKKVGKSSLTAACMVPNPLHILVRTQGELPLFFFESMRKVYTYRAFNKK